MIWIILRKAICIAMDCPSLNRDRGRHTLPAIYSQLLSTRDTSDLYDNRESRDDTEASVRWRRPDITMVTGRKLRTFKDFALVWTFNKFCHKKIILEMVGCLWVKHWSGVFESSNCFQQIQVSFTASATVDLYSQVACFLSMSQLYPNSAKSRAYFLRSCLSIFPLMFS